ncbi:MAG: DUF5706 domain-containing protein [Coriobacteriia bacterium]|nr:DUF5706 domain-containing protein [Coriobacteriia bacterium]
MAVAEGWSDGCTSLAQTLLGESRRELERADAKAIGLLSFCGLLVGVVVAGMIAGEWSPSHLGETQRLVWWAGAGMIVAAFTLFGSAVWPRTKKSQFAQNRECVTYFGDVEATWNLRHLGEVLERTCTCLPDRDGEQLLTIAKYARLKYSLIRWGMALYGLGALAATAAAL